MADTQQQPETAAGAGRTAPRRPRWRRTLRSLHRDIGFLCVGLTVVYAVSGVAVNHRHDWDYNQTVERRSVTVGSPAELLGVEWADGDPGALARERESELAAKVATALGRESAPIKSFWRGPKRLSLFFAAGGEDVADYDPTIGVALEVRHHDRPVLRTLNALHLNETGGPWTWIADAFALLLLFLALSGAFLVKGRHGLKGRGGVLIALGVALPILYALLSS